ncbi:MAG TPA: response regulator transcription factor [Ktedonobacterales bacterium]|nr:response regulator transcription factor [Ktedonobacterales bacterium]
MRVYVVAAYPTVRAGLAALVRERPGWIVAGQSALDFASPGMTAGEPPDVALADLEGVRDAGVIDALLAALRPRAGLVALGGPDAGARRGEAGREALRLVAEAARATEEQGLAFGALRRDATAEEIVAALGAVAGGLIALDRRLAGDLLAAPERVMAGAGAAGVRGPGEERVAVADETLTPRELEVLQLMAQGLPNKLIAQRLHITEHTAKFHVSAILTKLAAASRTEAVTIAARRGLLIL